MTETDIMRIVSAVHTQHANSTRTPGKSFRLLFLPSILEAILFEYISLHLFKKLFD